jgi:hypothetical protein
VNNQSTPEPSPAARHRAVVSRATTARRVAVVAAWAGAVLGVCAGIVQLTYGSSIPEWTGDKNDTLELGLATIALSVVAGVAIWRLLRTPQLWGRIVCAVIALACAIVCFTTVGRLWYLPGPLLIVATVAALVREGKGRLRYPALLRRMRNDNPPHLPPHFPLHLPLVARHPAEVGGRSVLSDEELDTKLTLML